MQAFGFDRFSGSLMKPPPLPLHLVPSLAEGVPTDCVNRLFGSLSSGCYYLNSQLYDPADPGSGVELSGTLRLEVEPTGLIGSGDLYIASHTWRPSPAMGIPIFPREDYRYYLRVEQVRLTSKSDVVMTLGAYVFESRSWWLRVATWEARVRHLTGPPVFPRPGNYYRGELMDTSGNAVGTMQFGWVSPMFRRASIEVAATEGVPLPPLRLPDHDSGPEISWEAIFREVGWELRLVTNSDKVEGGALDQDVVILDEVRQQGEPDRLLDGKIWMAAELHYEFGIRRPEEDLKNLLDREWRYYILCISRLSARRKRGLMFDQGFDGGNQLPREGAAVAAAFEFSGEEWGCLAGSMLYDHPDLFLRTAIHEVGHAMGLTHQGEATGHFGFMTTLDAIRSMMESRGLVGKSGDGGGIDLSHQALKEALCWKFAPQDALRLRHYPDYTVRPGGQPYNPQLELTPYAPVSKPTRSSAQQEKRLSLFVTPHPESQVLPLGAPARIELVLQSTLDEAVEASSLRLSEGFLVVTVQDPSRVKRRVQPLIHVVEGEETTQHIPAQGRLRHSLTLLRGDQGFLFPSPGQYHVMVHWGGLGGDQVSLAASTTLLVRDTEDSDGSVVEQLMSNPEVLNILALGGKRYRGHEAEAVLGRALSIERLAPHYRFIMLKHRFLLGDNLETAAQILGVDQGMIMTWAEIERIKLWAEKNPQILQFLQSRIHHQEGAIEEQLKRVLYGVA